MRKRSYESGIIINATLDDPIIEAVIEKVKTTILTNGGEIAEIENWGRKRLAYMIQKQKIGYYVFFRYDLPTDAVAKIERFFKLEETIVRFQTIVLDKFALEYFEQQKLNKPVVTEEAAVEPEATTQVEEEKKEEVAQTEEVSIPETELEAPVESIEEPAKENNS